VTARRSALLVVVACALPLRAAAQTNDEAPAELPGVPDPTFTPPKPELAEPEKLEPALRRGLDDPNGFCKNGDYELGPDERKLCELASASKGRCPGFAKACERQKFPFESADSARKGHGRSSRERSGRGKNSRDWSSDVSTGPISDLVGGIIQLIFWALLVFGIGAMLWAGVRALLGRRREAKSEDDSVLPSSVGAEPRPIPTGSPEELLARARELARAGDSKGAMAVVLRALLRHLEIAGRLELHPSRTNGDYVRNLRQRGYDPRELRRVAAEVEAIEFGGSRPTPEAFSELYSRVSKLVQVAGVVAVFLSLGLLTGCRKATPPPEGSVSSCGASATGYSALCETLEARGVKVRRRFSTIDAIADDVARVVVLEDDIEPDERKVLVSWVEDHGGTLVVLSASDSFAGIVPSGRVPCGDAIKLEAPAWKEPVASKRDLRLPDARGFERTASGRVHARCGDQPFVLTSFQGEGEVIAFADWRFATNAGLAIGDNAALAASLVAPPGATVELIGYFTGAGSELPAQSLVRSGLLPWFLQVLALCLAFALYKGSPFGSRREPTTRTRRAFAEHAQALGDAYSRARASRVALVHFGGYALERLRVRLSATKQGRLTDLAGAVAARHSVSEAEVMSLVVAVRSAEDEAHDSATETEHLAALRRLSALVKKTGGSS
jgi:hypothetical protein